MDPPSKAAAPSKPTNLEMKLFVFPYMKLDDNITHLEYQINKQAACCCGDCAASKLRAAYSYEYSYSYQQTAMPVLHSLCDDPAQQGGGKLGGKYGALNPVRRILITKRCRIRSDPNLLRRKPRSWLMG